MSYLTDQDYLCSEQYQDASNLNTRIQLHTRYSTNPMGLMPWIFNQIQFSTQGMLLDIGCGPADLWVENFGRLPQDWKITLADFSPGMIRQAVENLDNQQDRFSFLLCDVQEIPIKSETFNIIIANFMLYHVPNRQQALSEIHRVLKSNGRLYAATNGKNHLVEIRELVQMTDPDAGMDTAAGEFGLENGETQLSRFFGQVNQYRYDDSLVVPEEKPLVDYILSSHRSERIASNPTGLSNIIKKLIESEGALKIRKEVGVFEAIKGA